MLALSAQLCLEFLWVRELYAHVLETREDALKGTEDTAQVAPSWEGEVSRKRGMASRMR